MKKTLSILLSICMLLSITAGLSFSAYAGEWVKANTLKTGDAFQMGMYPQSEVTDSATKTALANISCTMKSYGYMKNSNAYSHTYDIVDMTYTDISFNGNVYRKVKINEYRPEWTDETSSSFQYYNGYTTGNTYYFKWEPIVWQVLAKESDGVYVMSKTLLDSQAYNNYCEATTWETSTLRTWLNEGFYAAAFSGDEQAKIVSVTHSNESTPEDYPYDSVISGGNDTTDKLWVLSYSDIINNAYGFSMYGRTADEARKAQGTDYAKSQGIYVDSSTGNSEWRLRTPGDDVHNAFVVDSFGYSGASYVNLTDDGIRPAFKLNLNSEIYKLDEKYSYCNHKAVVDKYVPATFTTTGKTEGKHCSVCGQVLTKQSVIAKLGSPKLTKLKKGKKSFTATWSKANGVDGYQVQYGLKKNFKKAKTKYTTGTKLTVKKLKSKKTYYVRIRAYKKINGKNYYSSWSTKKVKVK